MRRRARGGHSVRDWAVGSYRRLSLKGPARLCRFLNVWRWRNAIGSPNEIQKPVTRWPVVVGWGFFAAVAGLCCVVLPPHLTPGVRVYPSYGHPLVPWFARAFANLTFVPTLSAMFLLGAVVGLAQPRWWPLLGCLTVSLPMLLWGINFVHDVTIDSTSHNLFPFEIAMVMVLAVPALAAGGLGSLVRWAIQRSRNERPT